MGLLSKIFLNNDSTSKIFNDISKTIDAVHTSTEEKETLKNQLTATIQTHLSQRWLADNNGSFLTRNIRPMAFAFVLLVSSYLALFRPDLTLQLHYFDNILQIICLSYFSGRSGEKIIKTIFKK